MIRFFGRWALRLIVPALLFIVFVVQGMAGAIVGWAITAYLVWRAWPGVRKDLRRLWASRRRVTSSIARF